MADKGEAVTVSGECRVGMEELEALMPRLRAMPRASVHRPRKPADVIVRAAWDIYHAACADRAALQGLGLPSEAIDDVRRGAAAFAAAQVRWEQVQTNKRMAVREWEVLYPTACAVWRKLGSMLRYAYRDDPEALRQVPRQSGRPTHSRLVMDLACLVALARQKPEPLEAVHFDPALTAQARELAESLPRVLTAKRTTTGDRTWRDTRDRACTFLRMALSEVGECARTAFRDDTDRLRPYLHRTTHGGGAI